MIEREDQLLLVSPIEQILVRIVKKVNEESERHHIKFGILGLRSVPGQYHTEVGLVNESLDNADALRCPVHGTYGGRLAWDKLREFFDALRSAVDDLLPVFRLIRTIKEVDIRGREHPLHNIDELGGKIFECGCLGEFPKSLLERFYLTREPIGESRPRGTFVDGHASLAL